MTGRHDMNVWEHAVEVADAMGTRAEDDYTFHCIAVFPTHAEAERQRGSDRRQDILVASWGGTALLGARAHNIVVSRREFLHAASAGIEDGMELNRRRDYIYQMLLLKLVPGGRMVLV